MQKIVGILTLMLTGSALWATPAEQVIGAFATEGLNGWEEKSFSGHTQYRLVTESGTRVLEASSENSASGLYKKVDIDSKRYPFLHWRWKLAEGFSNRHEQSRKGDDFPARIYVIASTGWFFWQKQVLCYVWAQAQPPGHHWANPYTGEAVQMIAVRNSSTSQTGHWYDQQRNIYQDFQRYFGETVTHINSIAIMTDTDDTHKQATAYYGKIYFSRAQ